MPNPFGAPELTVQEVNRKLQQNEEFVWLDVREPNEFALVQIDDERIEFLPLSRLAAKQLEVVPDSLADKENPVVVMCHHGIRSAQVVMWLQQHGWVNVYNLDGGIEAWARYIDPSIGTY